MVTSLFNLSGGGMSPQEVQAMIDSALTAYTLTQDFATINESAITEGGDIRVAEPEEVLSAITAAMETETGRTESTYTKPSQFATINGSGITEGGNIEINGGEEVVWLQDIDTEKAIEIYANPQRYLIYSGSTENAFNVYRFRRMTGFIAEFCNEVTDLNADSTLTLYRKIIWVQEDGTVSHSIDNNFNIVTPNALSTTLSAYTPTANFATINGSGITQGGNITIEGGGIEVVDRNDIDSAKGLEMYANPERYLIKYGGNFYHFSQKNSSYVYYEAFTQFAESGWVELRHYYITIDTTGYDKAYSKNYRFYLSTDIDNKLAAKQNTLTAGSGINITNNVISATGGGGSIEVVRWETATQSKLVEVFANPKSYILWDGTRVYEPCYYAGGGDLLYFNTNLMPSSGNYIYYQLGIYYDGRRVNQTISTIETGGSYTLPTAGVGDNGVLGGVKVDGETININSNGVISATAGNAVQNLNGITGIWQGTQAQYDALATKDNNVFYIITL